MIGSSSSAQRQDYFQGEIEALIEAHNVPSFSCCQSKVKVSPRYLKGYVQ